MSERDGIIALKEAYNSLKQESEMFGMEMPQNVTDKRRELDCAVFEYLHSSLEKIKKCKYDTVVSYFTEGDFIYEGSSFKEFNHIQICVRNADCIKGYFLPRETE